MPPDIDTWTLKNLFKNQFFRLDPGSRQSHSPYLNCFRIKGTHKLLLAFLFFFMVFAYPVLSQENDSQNSQLRKFEKRLGQKDSQVPSNVPSPEEISRKDEAERLERKKRQQWEIEHPGIPYPTSNSDDTPDSFTELLFDSFLAPVVEWVIGLPFVIPYYATEDNYENPTMYSKYPFAENTGITSLTGKTWNGAGGLAYQWAVGGTVGTRTDLQITTRGRLSLDGAYTRYSEKTKSKSEYLSSGEILGSFIFARNEFVDFRAGLGFQHLEGLKKHDGVKTIYRTRIFLNPCSIRLDLGATIGMGRKVMYEMRPAVGIHYKRGEITLGYRRWSVSGEKIQGPELGFSLWF